MTLRPRAAALSLALLLALAACRMGPGPADVPDARPSDGLLERPELQRLVAFQIRRDAPGLIDALRSSDPDVRARAAFALASVQAPEAVLALGALLDDTVTAVRRDAAFALGQADHPAAPAALLGALAVEQEAGVRRVVMEALGRAGGAAALTELTGRPGGGPLWPERTLAMARLLLAGAPSLAATDSLAAWLDAPDRDVRFHAAWFFSRVEDPRVWASHRERILAALQDYAPDDPAAMHLVTVLGQMGVEADTPELLHWLRQARDWRIRANAALALEGRAGDPAVQEALLEALDHASVHVRVSAGTALAGMRQTPRVVALVRAWLASHPDDWQAAGPLLSVLVAAGEVEPVLAWVDRWPLDAVGPWTRAVEALMVLGGDAALERLVRAAGAEEPLVSAAALRALALRWPAERGRVGSHEAYWAAFSQAAASDGHGLSLAAAALADSIFVARGSVPLLLRAWERVASGGDPDVAADVITALGETGSPRVEPALREALAHPAPRLSDAAAVALLALAGDTVAAFDDGTGLAAGSSNADRTGAAPDRRSARARTVDWELLRALGTRPRLVLDTEEGRVVVALVPEEAPVTVSTVATLAREGSYDGVPFHRVVPNFVVQGGDVGRGDGSGGPGFAISTELTHVRFRRGTAGMASAGKDTEGSQFFLTHAPQPHLDGGYTAFGWVADGMDVVDRLAQGQKILRAAVVAGSGAAPEG